MGENIVQLNKSGAEINTALEQIETNTQNIYIINSTIGNSETEGTILNKIETNTQNIETINSTIGNSETEGTILNKIKTNTQNIETINSTIGNSETEGTILNKIETIEENLITNIQDYIVETGMTDIWTYRKWNNGTFECWGIYQHKGSVQCNTAWGNLYSTSNYPITFPKYPITFNEVPVSTIEYLYGSNESGSPFGFVIRKPWSISSTTPGNITLATPITPETFTNPRFSIYAMGRWK